MKTFTNVLVAAVVAAIVSVAAFFIVNGTTKTEPKGDANGTDTEVVKTPITTEFSTDVLTVVATDKEAMYNIAKEATNDSIQSSFYYFETDVKLADFVDESTECTPTSIINVFQLNKLHFETQECFTDVYFFVHNADGESYIKIIRGDFVVGDIALNDYPLNVNLAQAYESIQKADYKKPHTQYVTLRSEMGPKYQNPMWIFGNQYTGLLYVDVVTGEVKDSNPVK